MSTKYRAKTPLLISAAGLDIELDLHVEYSVSRYRAATLTQPEEPRSVEVEEIKATLNGLLAPLPVWLDDILCLNDGLKAHLLEDAAEKDICAAEDAADAKRKELRAAR